MLFFCWHICSCNNIDSSAVFMFKEFAYVRANIIPASRCFIAITSASPRAIARWSFAGAGNRSTLNFYLSIVSLNAVPYLHKSSVFACERSVFVIDSPIH